MVDPPLQVARQYGHHIRHERLQVPEPSTVAEHNHNGNRQASEILLMLYASINGYQRSEAMIGCHRQQPAVPNPRPAALLNRTRLELPRE